MNKKTQMSFILISTFIALTNLSSSRLNPIFTYSTSTTPTMVGSVPITHTAKRLVYVPNYPVHFIGDSRTVGLEQALQYYHYDLSNQAFTAKIGQGYSWFSRQTELTQLPPSILILNLGVNDLGNEALYQELYTAYADTCWKDSAIYIVSVNPCCSPCTSVSNQRIQAFNASMQQWIDDYNAENASAETETLPIRYINTYDYLITNGFQSPDGLHYSADTYCRLYDYILSQIQESIGDGSGTYVYETASPTDFVVPSI